MVTRVYRSLYTEDGSEVLLLSVTPTSARSLALSISIAAALNPASLPFWAWGVGLGLIGFRV